MGEKAPDVVVTRRVDAPPASVWALVGDPARIGEISPECYRISWLGGATGPAVGARFVGWNRKGILRWPTTSTVAELEPQRHVSWDVDVLGQSVARWSFTVEPDGAGLVITQRWRDRRTKVAEIVGKSRTGDSPSHNRRGMEQTLDTVARRAAGPPG